VANHKVHKAQQCEADPDFFDVLIQSLSVLSNVATLATTWVMLRSSQPRIERPEQPIATMVRDNLRDLERDLSDVFDDVDSILRSMESAFSRISQQALLDQPAKFGTTVYLTQPELMAINSQLVRLSGAAQSVRTNVQNVRLLLTNAKIPGEDRIVFDLDDFNDELNDILFNSRTFGEAVTKLRLARERAEKFVRCANLILRGN
jgi:hypothetical protein